MYRFIMEASTASTLLSRLKSPYKVTLNGTVEVVAAVVVSASVVTVVVVVVVTGLNDALAAEVVVTGRTASDPMI